MSELQEKMLQKKSRIIDDFREENKALKDELKTTQDIAFELTESLRKEGVELEKVKKSRNELLKSIHDRFGDGKSDRFKDRYGENFFKAIQKAETL